MSSLQRARSSRKTPSIASQKLATAAAAPAEPSRSSSPSRLPVKPPARTASSSTAATSTSAASTIASARGGRSVSAAPTRLASSRRQNGAPPPAWAPAPLQPAPREPAASRHPVRSSMMARPMSTGSAAAAQVPKRAATHARARSTTTAAAPNPATVLRPPSGDRLGAVAARGGSGTADRAPSTPTAALRPPHPQPRLRPAFSTLQQHYSPAKNLAPKPLTSTLLAPPSPSKLPANVAASAETNKLQAELLQMHLLHRDAAPAQARWQASAKEKLGERFARLREASIEVADRERAGAERRNVLALRRWGRSGRDLDEKIRSLEEVLSGLWALSEAGGRYNRLVRRFERWIDGVGHVEEARGDADNPLLLGQDSLFIGELDALWRDECAAMARRLEGWQAQLREIDDLPAAGQTDGVGVGGGGGGGGGRQSCSLERMLAGARSLLGDMLAELRVMDDVEQEALAREQAWIERMNKEGEDEEKGDHDTPRAGAVWRTV